MLRTAIAGLLDLLAPPTCAACAGPLVTLAEGFCAACRPLIDVLPSGLTERVDRDACWYGGPLRDALRRLKYEGASELAGPLAALLMEPAQHFAGLVDCVAAVPLHPRRLRERGYNQSMLLARPVARALALPLWPRLLARVRDTPAQVGRDRPAREQLARAFRAEARARGRAVLVVDDVRTTGATLAEARRALDEAGARAVYTLALARTPAA